MSITILVLGQKTLPAWGEGRGWKSSSSPATPRSKFMPVLMSQIPKLTLQTQVQGEKLKDWSTAGGTPSGMMGECGVGTRDQHFLRKQRISYLLPDLTK